MTTNNTPPNCSYTGCHQRADFQGRWWTGPAGHTHACEHHIGYLLPIDPNEPATVVRIPM